MRFVVNTLTFQWAGVTYFRGDEVEIPEGHPNLDALVNASRQLRYSSSKPLTKDEAARRRRHNRARLEEELSRDPQQADKEHEKTLAESRR